MLRVSHAGWAQAGSALVDSAIGSAETAQFVFAPYIVCLRGHLVGDMFL